MVVQRMTPRLPAVQHPTIRATLEWVRLQADRTDISDFAKVCPFHVTHTPEFQAILQRVELRASLAADQAESSPRDRYLGFSYRVHDGLCLQRKIRPTNDYYLCVLNYLNSEVRSPQTSTLLTSRYFFLNLPSSPEHR
jgi:hypothetical protein